MVYLRAQILWVYISVLPLISLGTLQASVYLLSKEMGFIYTGWLQGKPLVWHDLDVGRKRGKDPERVLEGS